MYLTVSMGPSHMESPTGFSQASTLTTPTPQHPNGVSPHFPIEALPSVASPFFSSLEPSKHPPKNMQDFNRS